MAEAERPQYRFLIDETAVETRLAVLVHGRLVMLKLFPRVAPGADRARVGDVYLARVMKAARGMSGCFVDLGRAGEGLLRAKAPLAEGALFLCNVVRSGYGSKLTLLSLAGGKSESAGSDPHRVSSALGAVELAFDRAWPGDEILIDGKEAWLQGQSAMRGARLSEITLVDASVGLFEHEGVEAQIENALEPVVPLAGGGRLIIEETQALTAIDVDIAGAQRAADVNLRAAQEIAYQIAARRLAGVLIVDFAQVRRTGDLVPLKERLQSVASEIALDLRIGVASRTGLLELQRTRNEAPLSAALTRAGVTHGSLPVTWNDEAETARLARAIRATSARLTGALDVCVQPSLGEWLTLGDGYSAWEAIVRSSAAPLYLKADAALNTQAFAMALGEVRDTRISKA